MRRLISAIFLLSLSASSATLAQETSNKAVVIPSEIYFPTIVVQPDSPLKIEKAVVAKMLDGTQNMFVQARNTGSKAIVFFQVDMITSNGSGIGSIFPYRRTQGSVLPGELAPSPMNAVEFVPLTEALKERLRLTGKMRGFVFFMVLKIEFEDGSTYDATPLHESLEEHLRTFQRMYEKTDSPW